MIKILGYVSLQNTDVGIPNLVVAAYDAEKPLHEIIKEHKTENGFAASLMEHLGNRISSVLTGSTGRFFIDTEDLAFDDNKPRPDLVVVVFAPEDIFDRKNPVPKAPEKRILYLSNKPRVKAGAEEAYVIRLLPEQLEEFNIPVPTEKENTDGTQASVNHYLKKVEDSFILKERTKELAGHRLREKQEKNTEARKMIRDKLKNLSALPRAVRKNSYLLKDPNELEIFQKKVVKEGLKKFGSYENSLRLNVTSADLESLQIKPDDEAPQNVTVDTSLLSKKLKELTGGVDLIRKKELLPSQIDPLTLYNKYFSNANRDELINNENPE